MEHAREKRHTISRSLLTELYRYFIAEIDAGEKEVLYDWIKAELQGEIDRILSNECYRLAKTGKSEEEREKAFEKYIREKRGGKGS